MGDGRGRSARSGECASVWSKPGPGQADGEVLERWQRQQQQQVASSKQQQQKLFAVSWCRSAHLISALGPSGLGPDSWAEPGRDDRMIGGGVSCGCMCMGVLFQSTGNAAATGLVAAVCVPEQRMPHQSTPGRAQDEDDQPRCPVLAVASRLVSRCAASWHPCSEKMKRFSPLAWPGRADVPVPIGSSSMEAAGARRRLDLVACGFQWSPAPTHRPGLHFQP